MTHPWDRPLGVWNLAEHDPDAPAVVASPSGPRTYAELAGRAHQLVHALRGRGLERGAAVALIAPNGVEMVECSLACQEAGWFFVPLNTFLTADELEGMLQAVDIAALFVHERFADRIPASMRPRTFGIGNVGGVTSVDELLDGQPSTMPDDRATGGLITFTSGTTGAPKPIRRPVLPGDPTKTAQDAAIFGRAFDFRPMEGPHLVSTAMYHGGSHSFYMGALHVGHALVIMDRFDPEEALRLIEAHRVTTAYMVPTQFHRLLRLPDEVKDRYDLSSLHAVAHSAAPCPREVKEQMMAWWGPVIWETYGGMEGPATIAKPHRWLERPGTVGRAIKGTSLSVLDDDGQPLPPGGQGLVQITNAYGSFTLGDIGELDADGYLFIHDRAKDMIITGGVNVYPQQVESALTMHPAVADVAVIGVPDEEWGEQVKAVVQPVDGVEPTSELADELIAWCRERLASYKCPRSVDFRADLPRTDAGKLYKRHIRDEYWQQVGRAV